ncbi:MAG: S4 domain-containing protein, partial [Candidatus Krumholzibacteriia bacterium]
MTSSATPPESTLRLNVFLARAGHGSRRSVEDLVRAGRVAIGGEVVRDLARRVDVNADVVTVDGARASLPDGSRVYAFHKPLGVVSSMAGQGDQIDLDAMRRRSDIDARFHPVGRLDRDSSGLLLWTDDGHLSQALLRPEQGVWKTYEVQL